MSSFMILSNSLISIIDLAPTLLAAGGNPIEHVVDKDVHGFAVGDASRVFNCRRVGP